MLTSAFVPTLLVLSLTTYISLFRLFHENPLVMTPALRTLGNIVSGNDNQTQVTLDAGILPPLTRLLHHPKKIIRKETCWALSNIAAGTVAQIGLLCGTTGLLAGVAASLAEGEWDIQKEAAWIISNLVAGGSAAHIERLMEIDGLLQAFVAVLSKSDIDIIMMVLEAIEALLKTDNSYRLLLEEAEGLVSYIICLLLWYVEANPLILPPFCFFPGCHRALAGPQQ